jgi:MFS family permease
MFDSTLMASSHPVITSYFNASNSASWLSTAFLLTSTSLQPLMGRLSDTFGRRPLYLAGLLLLAATTAWCAAANSIGSFIAARAFCGIGAAGVLSMGNVMTNDLVSIEVRGTYQAYINLFYGGGSACGAAFGGFLCDQIGWRMTFAIQVPFILALLINAFFTTPSTLGPNLAKTSGLGFRDAMKGFDIAGSFLLTSSVAFLILGLNLGGNIFPWGHPLVIVSLVVGFIAGATLVYVESRAGRPVMPLPMLFSEPRGNLVFNNFFAQIGMNTILFNAPLYFQAVKLETASVSGFRLAGPSVALTICGVSAGFIMTATGRMKWLIVTGSLSMLIGATCLSSMWDNIPSWLATIFLVPSSIGQGLSFPATSLAVLATSSQEDQAVMTSTLILWRSLGIVMGVSVSSLILQNALTAYLEQLVTGHNKSEVRITSSLVKSSKHFCTAPELSLFRFCWLSIIMFTALYFCDSIRASSCALFFIGRFVFPHEHITAEQPCSMKLTLLRLLTVSANPSAASSPSTLSTSLKVRPFPPAHHVLGPSFALKFCISSLALFVIFTAPQANAYPVIDAYSRSLRIVFFFAVAVFLIVNILVFAIRLPHLKKKEGDVEEEEEENQRRT